MPYARRINEDEFGDYIKVVLETAPEYKEDFCEDAFYVVAYDGEPAAAGKLVKRQDGFFIEFLAVMPKKRGLLLGDLVARMLIRKAFNLNAESVKVKTPEKYEAFFERFSFTVYKKEKTAAYMECFCDVKGSCGG